MDQNDNERSHEPPEDDRSSQPPCGSDGSEVEHFLERKRHWDSWEAAIDE
ncbi:MAG TPA: hypothetical protein V6D12_07745 [Candidatus Obscuribacterales bacterium]